jgi:hypothetical protein
MFLQLLVVRCSSSKPSSGIPRMISSQQLLLPATANLLHRPNTVPRSLAPISASSNADARQLGHSSRVDRTPQPVPMSPRRADWRHCRPAALQLVGQDRVTVLST